MNKYILSLFVLILFQKCTSQKEKVDLLDITSIQSFKESSVSMKEVALEGTIEFTIQDSSFTIDWIPYWSNDEQLSFSIPSYWKIIDDQSALLFCRIGNHTKSYFALLVHDKETNDLTLDGYKDLMIQRLNSDTLEFFDITEYSRFESAERGGYFFSVRSNRDQVKSKFYTMVTDTEKYILDFSMRLYGSDIDTPFKEVFNVVVHSFQVYGIPIFSSKSKFTEIKVGID